MQDPAKHYVCEEILRTGDTIRHPVQAAREAKASAQAAVAFGRLAPAPYRPTIVRVVDTLTARAVMVRRVA